MMLDSGSFPIEVITGYEAIFDMNISWRLVEMQETNGRNDHPTFGIENEAGFDLPDELGRIDHSLDLVEFEYCSHRHVSSAEMADLYANRNQSG